MRLEHLSKISPSSVNLNHVPGSKAEITSEMVSAALGYAQLSDLASLYCRLKYQMQGNLRDKVEYIVFHEHVLIWAVEEGWQCKTSIIPALCKTALDEMLSGDLCKQCDGSGWDGRCEKCAGTGLKPYSKAETARRLGIDRQHYGRTYLDRYTRVINLFEGLEDEISRGLGRLG